MWGKKRSGTMLQALHFSFALGAFISPLVAAPFLAETTNSTMLVLPSPMISVTLASPLISTVPGAPNGNITVPDAPNGNITVPGAPNGNITVPDAPNGNITVPDAPNGNITVPDAPNGNITVPGAPNGNITVPDAPNGNITVPDAPNKNITLNTEGTAEPIITEGGNKSIATKGGNKSNDTKLTHQREKREIVGGTVKPITTAEEDTPLKSEQPAPEHEVERFAMPFIIIGILVLLTCGLFFYLLCTKPKEEPGYTGSEHSDGTSVKDNSPFRTRILVLLFFFYFLYVGGEVAYGSFVPMFASKSQHHFEQDRASHVAALFWGAFALGRGLAICLASVISPLKMVIADMVGCVTASLALTLFADSNENILWICSALLGLSMASLFPTGIVWLETYTPVTGNTASFLIVGSALGEMCVPVLIGYLFEDRIGPMVLMYWMLATSALSALIFVYVFWLMAESGREKKSLPAEKSPALELFQSVEEALPMEELFKNGGSNNKQMSKPRVPPILKRKNHKE